MRESPSDSPAAAAAELLPAVGPIPAAEDNDVWSVADGAAAAAAEDDITLDVEGGGGGGGVGGMTL